MKLVALSGTRAIELVPGRTLTVGRGEDCDVPIPDATVSRRHAELDLVAAGLHLRDLGSANGTFLDGRRVSDAVALPGAQIAFGQVAFELRRHEIAEDRSQQPQEAQRDLTILRQRKVGGPSEFAAQLAGAPGGEALIRIGGESAAERQEKKLALLIDVAKELSRQADIDRLLDKVVNLTFQVMSADRVAILMSGSAGELTPRLSRRRGAASGDADQPVPRSIASKVVDERLALLIDNAPADGRFAGGSILAQSVKSAMCAPLLGGQGTVLGLIYLDNQGATHSFGEEDLSFLTAFSGIAAVAIENHQLLERARREAVVLSNFQRYFAPDLARQIAGEERVIQLGGAKREVVILFSDIRGFTPMSEQMTPDEIASLLNEYFSEMVETIFEHGGTLDKFIGDALMALWGAPLARHDDADQAIRAAIAMQRRLDRLNADWSRLGRRTIAAGMGLNAGEVFAGNIGSDRRLEYTVLGDPVNTASRLCSQAGPGQILISESLYRKLGSPPPVRELEPLRLKGKAQPVPVFSIER